MDIAVDDIRGDKKTIGFSFHSSHSSWSFATSRYGRLETATSNNTMSTQVGLDGNKVQYLIRNSLQFILVCTSC